MQKIIYILTLLSLSFTISAQNSDKIKMNKFVDDLLNKMTLEEKIGQTVLYTSGYDVITGPTVDPNYKEYLKKGMVGGIFNGVGADYTRSLQKIAVEETRLGIPLLFGYDVIHGYKTIFPMPLAESCSWDLDAIENSARIASKEATAEGINWIFAPMVDIARDARWGRIVEGAGEDVYWGSLVAAARIRGIQGKDLKDRERAMACVKHFAAYGASMAGRDYNTVDVSLVELWNTYLPPFKAALYAGSATIMTAFNDLNGIPATANKYLLKDILIDKWKFDGFVVSDYTSVNEMIPHGYARDEKHSAELSMNAGLDMDMQGGVFMKYLKELIAEGKVLEKDVTLAARKILIKKYELGLFEDPYRYSDSKREKTDIMTAEHKEAARDMARKSFVLLKNDNQVLPLTSGKKIALIGPMIKDKREIIGSWSAMGDRTNVPVSIYEGMVEAVGEHNLLYAKGCDIESDDTSGFEEAVKTASQADIVVVSVGEFHNMTGENNSRAGLDLPGVQLQLLKKLKETGKPIVMVLMSGRPMTITWENAHLDAILDVWFPGTMGGAAIADVLTGKYNPSGKLTVTFPQVVGQIPLFYNHKSTGRPFDASTNYGSRYWDVSNDPLYPFGYGLSYTTFEYADMKLSSETITKNSPLKISVKVSNTGKYDGEEVVQLYTRDVIGSITRPVKELKGYSKIFLKAGESRIVDFTLTVDDLRFYNADLEYVYEIGDFSVFVGGNSQKTLEGKFTLK
ncbi:beta-glucosidase BglX [Prevotella sp. 10(H)]|uniref:beta-glucosidase BglX n=1 Tax=Prevotella sp. 10(H) TaxID=1158294 RepID=UPI0004A6BF8B|nr:beta-glucosidase BglX [Prevotella sp. 10(H)]